MGFRLPCGHCVCEEICTFPSCPRCDAVLSEDDDVKSFRANTAQDPRTITAPSDAPGAAPREEPSLPPSAVRLLTGSNHGQLLDTLKDIIAILENLAVASDSAMKEPDQQSDASTSAAPRQNASADCAAAAAAASEDEQRQGEVANPRVEAHEAQSFDRPDSLGEHMATLPNSSAAAATQSVQESETLVTTVGETSSKTAIAALNEALQQLGRFVPAAADMKWECHESEGRWMATLVCAFLPHNVSCPQPQTTKKAAQHAAAKAALPDFRKKLVELQSSSPSAEPALMKDLQEEYQRLFKVSPAWEIRTGQTAQGQSQFQAQVLHEGDVVDGPWKASKADAKRALLEELLKRPVQARGVASSPSSEQPRDDTAAVPEPPVQGLPRSAGSSHPQQPPHAVPPSAKMKDLQEEYQRRFRVSPAWGEVEEEQSPKGPQPRFRARLLHRDAPATGPWMNSKAEAKRVLLLDLLARNELASTASSSRCAGIGQSEAHPEERKPQMGADHSGPAETSMGRAGAASKRELREDATVYQTQCSDSSTAAPSTGWVFLEEAETQKPPSPTSGGASATSMMTLNEEYQRRFLASPVWKVETSHLSSVQPQFRAKLVHGGGEVIGLWMNSKSDAKRTLLEEVLARNVLGRGAPSGVASPPEDESAVQGELSAGSPPSRSDVTQRKEPPASALGSLSDVRGATSLTTTSDTTLTALQERYQQMFRSSPTWRGVEISADVPSRFRATVHGTDVTGDWMNGKQEAKYSALDRVLGEALPAAITPSLRELQELYQSTFRVNPKFVDIKESADCPPRFLATLLHDDRKLLGDWSSSKQSAKCSALLRVPNLRMHGSS
eukprot:TRINITY_DN19051_c0_g1_i2.p1 TRINITY_DN19051_c0_g1~~TRINITY_DN19051_c0_g1_i2.p1  ORF type:complete len:841 (+),score=148.90 TRINITY_DN19051_c0_g1_i2:189-2711(+)